MASRLAGTVRSVVGVMRENHVTFMAGSVAYSAFMSILPLLVLSLVVATVIGGDGLTDLVFEFAGTYLTPTGRDLFTSALTNDPGRAGTSLLGVALLVWGTLRVFRGLDVAFSEIYGAAGDASFADQVTDGLVVLTALGIAIAATVAVGSIASLYPGQTYLEFVSPLVLVLGLVVAFLPIFYVFPDADVSVREILPGVAFAAVGWTILEVAFRVYVSYAERYTLYGTIGAVLLVLTWLYVASLLLLVGAALNVVLSERRVPVMRSETSVADD